MTARKRNTQPGAPTFLTDPRQPRPGEQIGSGIIVFRRGKGSGRIRAPEWPFEHPTLAAAHEEADRLAEKYPGERFDVMLSVGTHIHLPDVAADAPAVADTDPDDDGLVFSDAPPQGLRGREGMI